VAVIPDARASGSSPVPVIRRGWLGGVELALGPYCDTVGTGKIGRFSRTLRQSVDEIASGHLDEGQRVGRQFSQGRRDVLAVEVVARAADRRTAIEHLLPVLHDRIDASASAPVMK
jgi:hypothetical protein